MRRLTLLASLLVGGCGATTPNSSLAHFCVDFMQDGNESDVDCGGSCLSCAGGRRCNENDDCASDNCGTAGRCLDNVVLTVDASDDISIGSAQDALVTPGTQAGYSVTKSDAGDGILRLQWTAAGAGTAAYHAFYGSIYSAGAITAVTTGCNHECNFDGSNYLSLPAYDISGGQAVDFESIGTMDLEGIDITVMDSTNGSGQPVYFDLYIDGARHPELVFYPTSTGTVASPTAIPFGILGN